jgi:hypothetical protein
MTPVTPMMTPTSETGPEDVEQDEIVDTWRNRIERWQDNLPVLDE